MNNTDNKQTDILLGNDATVPIVNGILKAVAVVASTMGPEGDCVVIPNVDNSEMNSQYRLTKDGVSVIKSIRLSDPIENLGASLIKDAALKTLEEAGDGTTTATVLTGALLRNLMSFNKRELKQYLEKELTTVLETLKESSKKITINDIESIAKVSANNDETISKLVKEAFTYSDNIKLIRSNLRESRVLFENGSVINTDNLTPDNLTDPQDWSSNLKNPSVLIINGKLNSIITLKAILKDLISDKNKSLVIFAEYISHSVESTLKDYFNEGYKIVVVKSPGMAEHRQNVLKDLSVITGAKIIDEGSIPTVEDLGKLSNISVRYKDVIITKDKSISVKKHLSNLEKQRENDDLDNYSKELLDIRINILKGKLSVIKVGGRNDIEISEKYDRFEDSIKAVRCALEEGIVEGGGVALLRQSLNKLTLTSKGRIEYSEPVTMDEAFYTALMSPYLQIQENGHSFKIDLRENTMFEQDIVDPLKVTRVALTNAIAVINNVLSIQSIVTDSRTW